MAEQLKQLYNKNFINQVSGKVIKFYPKFDAVKFQRLVFSKDWKNKELKQRMRHITLCLHKVLALDFSKTVAIFKSISKEIESVGFEWMILPDYIEVFGEKHWSDSISALEDVTKIASSEFAIRPFILKNPSKTMKVMQRWSKSKNYHVRRLASEGCRPNLPWAMGLPMFKSDPSMVLPILEQLKTDPELYVRRSVANNLNDISKNNPDVVIKLLKKWNKDKSPNMKWLIKHSLRTLEKKGDPNALTLLGFSTNIKIAATQFKVTPKKITMGEKIQMSVELSTPSKQAKSIVVDYLVYHVKSNGKLTPKTFKWCKKNISSDLALELKKQHSIKEISTRKYYPGTHEIHVQVNGKIVAKNKFTLKF